MELEFLEGVYFAFEFYADYTLDEGDEGALAILQVNNGKLKDVWHPCDHALLSRIGEEQNRKALEFLKKNGAKCVYTLSQEPRDGQFLGMELHYDSDRNSRRSGDRTFCDYNSLNDPYWKGYLEAEGIMLIRYDPVRNCVLGR